MRAIDAQQVDSRRHTAPDTGALWSTFMAVNAVDKDWPCRIELSFPLRDVGWTAPNGCWQHGRACVEGRPTTDIDYLKGS